MKVKLERVNKYHRMRAFLDEFVASDQTVMDITEVECEYCNPWSLYMSVWGTAKRFNIRVTVHLNHDEIYIEKIL